MHHSIFITDNSFNFFPTAIKMRQLYKNYLKIISNIEIMLTELSLMFSNDIRIIRNFHKITFDHSAQKLFQKKRGKPVCLAYRLPLLSMGDDGGGSGCTPEGVWEGCTP